MGHDLITIVDGQDVAVAQVQAWGGWRQREEGEASEAKLWAFNEALIYFFRQHSLS